MSRLSINLVSDLSQAQLEANLVGPVADKSQQIRKLETALRAAEGGASALTVEVSSGAVTASGTITCASVANNDTVTINGVVLTAKTASPGAGEWLIGATDALSAKNLAALINSTTTLQWVADASISGAVVTCSAGVIGPLGNAVTLVSSNGTRLAVSGAGTLAGGTNGTMNRLAFNRQSV